jgi:hypothetical protein
LRKSNIDILLEIKMILRFFFYIMKNVQLL